MCVQEIKSDKNVKRHFFVATRTQQFLSNLQTLSTHPGHGPVCYTHECLGIGSESFREFRGPYIGNECHKLPCTKSTTGFYVRFIPFGISTGNLMPMGFPRIYGLKSYFRFSKKPPSSSSLCVPGTDKILGNSWKTYCRPNRFSNTMF